LLKNKPRAGLHRGKQARTSTQREKPNARLQRGKQARPSAQQKKPRARLQRGKQERSSAQQKKPRAALHRGKQARTSTQREKPNARLQRGKKTNAAPGKSQMSTPTTMKTKTRRKAKFIRTIVAAAKTRAPWITQRWKSTSTEMAMPGITILMPVHRHRAAHPI
jgi:hypothetical protein